MRETQEQAVTDPRNHSGPGAGDARAGGSPEPDAGAANRRGGALRSTLHRRGLRMTPQRQLVLDAVRELAHATPEQVCRRVQQTAPTVNITTVYRALDLLEELALVRHTHLGHGAPTYSVEEHEHVHLVCHRCGHVDEVPCEMLDGLAGVLDAERGFGLDATHLALSGTCRSCRTDPPVTTDDETATTDNTADNTEERT